LIPFSGYPEEKFSQTHFQRNQTIFYLMPPKVEGKSDRNKTESEM